LADGQAVNVLVLLLGVEAHAQELGYLRIAKGLHTHGAQEVALSICCGT
jgi:hypothetical protein